MFDLGTTAYSLPGSYLPVATLPADASGYPGDRIAAYAAATPTMWDAWTPWGSDPGFGASLLDALRALAYGATTAVQPPPAALEAEPEPQGAAEVAEVDEPVASVRLAAVPAAVAPVIEPVSEPRVSTERAVLGFSRGSTKARTRSVVTGARRHGTELWAGVRNPTRVHVTQVLSRYNPSPAAGNRDCGPASVVMSLRMLGKRVPGVSATASPQRIIHRARVLAGQPDETVATTNFELERALARAGTTTTEIADLASIKAAVEAGHPVILNGNPRNPGAYGWRFKPSQMMPYDGGHWIVVSGYDTKSGKYIINDPLSTVGPVRVSRSQLEAYRGGSIGIEVAAS